MGLKLRLILVLMVPVVLLAGVYGYTRSRWEQAELLEDQRDDMARTGKAVRIAVENALRDRQLADIRRLLAELVEYQEAIDRIRLFDARLTPVAISTQLALDDDVPTEALRRAISSGEPQSYTRILRSRPLLYYITAVRDQSGHPAGALELVQVATRAQARILAANRDIVLRLALLVGSIALLAGLMLQRQVLRPLARLMDGIHRLARGERGEPLPIERRDELGRVAEAFNDMSARLDAAHRDLVAETERALDLERQLREAVTLGVAGKLTSSIAHEIGTPLNIISGRAEFLLKAAPADSPVRRDLKSIVVQIERISRAIHALLERTVDQRGHEPRGHRGREAQGGSLMFADLEAFVEAHRPCGEFDADVGEQTDDGYRVRVSCPCGAAAEYWITRRCSVDQMNRIRWGLFATVSYVEWCGHR